MQLAPTSSAPFVNLISRPPETATNDTVPLQVVRSRRRRTGRLRVGERNRRRPDCRLVAQFITQYRNRPGADHLWLEGHRNRQRRRIHYQPRRNARRVVAGQLRAQRGLRGLELLDLQCLHVNRHSAGFPGRDAAAEEVKTGKQSLWRERAAAGGRPVGRGRHHKTGRQILAETEPPHRRRWRCCRP